MIHRGVKRWLEVTAWNRKYWALVAEQARELNSDGCSGVPDRYRWTCLEHDIHYRTRCFVRSIRAIDKETADYIFRVRIQQGSPFGCLSPISWVRWLGVRWFGNKAWEGIK